MEEKKKEIIALIQHCSNEHFVNVIYAYVKRLIGNNKKKD